MRCFSTKSYFLAVVVVACGPSAGNPNASDTQSDATTVGTTGPAPPTTGSGDSTTIVGENSGTLQTGSMSASSTTSTTAADSSTSTAGDPDTGESTTTDPTTATGVDTEDPPDGFNCEGTKWFTVITEGQLGALGLDSRGHTIGFGSHQGAPNSDGHENMLIVDLDPAGAVVRAYEPKTPYQDWLTAGGVDGNDNVYAIASTRDLHKFTVDGAKVAAANLDEDRPGDYYSLSVAPNGDLTIGHTSLITRRGSDLAIKWQLDTDLSPYDANSAGAIIARRWPDDLVLINTDGAIVWETTWDYFGNPELAINEAGRIVAGDRDNSDQVVIASYSPDGSMLWETHFGVFDKFDNIIAVAIDSAGNVAAAGSIQSGGLHGFIVRLDKSGEIISQHTCPFDQEITFNAIAFDDKGNIRVGGEIHHDFTYYSFVAAY